MSSNCDLCKSKFEQVFDSEIPLNNLNEQKTWHYWEKNENDKLEKKLSATKIQISFFYYM